MAQSTTLKFQIHDDRNRVFEVTFDSESRKRNLLQEVLFLGLPLDTAELRHYDLELYKNICNLMRETAKNYWTSNEKEEVYA